jgi:hypothetical protein
VVCYNVSIGVSGERIAFIFKFRQFFLLVLLDSENGDSGKCGWLNEWMGRWKTGRKKETYFKEYG